MSCRSLRYIILPSSSRRLFHRFGKNFPDVGRTEFLFKINIAIVYLLLTVFSWTWTLFLYFTSTTVWVLLLSIHSKTGWRSRNNWCKYVWTIYNVSVVFRNWKSFLQQFWSPVAISIRIAGGRNFITTSLSNQCRIKDANSLLAITHLTGDKFFAHVDVTAGQRSHIILLLLISFPQLLNGSLCRLSLIAHVFLCAYEWSQLDIWRINR